MFFVVRKGKGKPLSRRSKIRVYDQLQTGPRSSCFFKFKKKGPIIGLAEDSRFLVKAQGSQLIKGMAWIRKRAGWNSIEMGGSRLTLKTQEGDFFLKVNDNGRAIVVVRTGRVEVSSRGKKFILGPMGWMSFYGQSPPEIRGIAKQDLLEWEEPFEKF